MAHCESRFRGTLPSVVQTTVFFFLSKPPIWNPSSESKTLYSSVSGSVICIGGGGNEALSLYSNSSYSSSSSFPWLQNYSQLTNGGTILKDSLRFGRSPLCSGFKYWFLQVKTKVEVCLPDGPISIWGSIETMIIGKMHPTLHNRIVPR